MFFDHGNHGGSLFGLLLLLLGFPVEVVWIGFALAWFRTAYPDLAPVFEPSSWRLCFRSEDWTYRIRLQFEYRWIIYGRYHFPPEGSSTVMRYDPFLLLHRLVDVPAHSIRAKADDRYRVTVYVITAVAGWLLLGTLILLTV